MFSNISDVINVMASVSVDSNACKPSDAISAGQGQNRDSHLSLFLTLEWGQNNVTLVMSLTSGTPITPVRLMTLLP